MPASKRWQQVQQLEDVMALLLTIEEEAEIIRRHAWRQGSWGEVFNAAQRILYVAHKLHRQAAHSWPSLVERARADD